MITKKKRTTAIFAVVFLILGVLAAHYLWESWGFYRRVPEEEAALRTQVVETAERYLGCQEADGSFKAIIDLYNSQESLPMGYEVQYTDSWCAVFVSAVAMECGITDILPTECSCERQIGLFQDLGCWEEDDSAIPLPGDVIYYDWDEKGLGDCTGWADHGRHQMALSQGHRGQPGRCCYLPHPAAERYPHSRLRPAGLYIPFEKYPVRFAYGVSFILLRFQ